MCGNTYSDNQENLFLVNKLVCFCLSLYLSEVEDLTTYKQVASFTRFLHFMYSKIVLQPIPLSHLLLSRAVRSWCKSGGSSWGRGPAGGAGPRGTSRQSKYVPLSHLLLAVGQYVLGAGQEVVPEEEAPQGVLDPAAHLDQVLQDVLPRQLVRLDVHHTHRD